MSRGPQSSREQRQRIQQLVVEGYKATEIYRKLEDEDLLSDPHPALVLRTVQRMVSKITPHDESGGWCLRDATPEEARLVLDVLVDTYDRTEGRIWLTNDLARWIVKLRRAVPNLSPAVAYLYARAYQLVGSGDTRELDLMVGLERWRTAGETEWDARFEKKRGKVTKVMQDQDLLTREVTNILTDIYFQEMEPGRNLGQVPADSNSTAKREDSHGQEETNHSEE